LHGGIKDRFLREERSFGTGPVTPEFGPIKPINSVEPLETKIVQKDWGAIIQYHNLFPPEVPKGGGYHDTFKKDEFGNLSRWHGTLEIKGGDKSEL
jgi:hypothetical protein